MTDSKGLFFFPTQSNMKHLLSFYLLKRGEKKYIKLIKGTWKPTEMDTGENNMHLDMS